MELTEQRWTQSTIFPPGVVQANIRVAWIAETNHVQWQLEVSDPVTGELYAMSSVPHRDAQDADRALTLAMADLRRLWLEVVDPDPF